MLNLHVQVANERFLSRYGVDRILMLMARDFAAQGAKVTFACLRYNPDFFEKSDTIVSLPAFESDIFDNIDKFSNAERIATQETMAAWLEGKPDIVLIGGWPFFDLAARAGSVGVKSIFIDAGATPQTGMAPSAQQIQQELRRIRAQTLPFIDKVLPISDFIRYSQTEPDRLSARSVRTIHLGADHLLSAPPEPSDLLSRLKAMKSSGTRLLLAAGRFEPSGYKNSMSAIDVARGVRAHVPDIKILVLQPAEHLAVSPDVKDIVVGLGFPSDHDLLEILRLVDVTLSTSLWEGFNLPLAEAQREGCPTLAYACGSHPEVVADPWFLCQSEAEMARKAVEVLEGSIPEPSLANLSKYKDRFPWKETLSRISREVGALAAEPVATGTARRLVFVDVSAHTPFSLNAEALDVARDLTSSLGDYPEIEVVFAHWNDGSQTYTLSPDGTPGNPLAALQLADIGSVEIDRLVTAASQRCASPPLLFYPLLSTTHDLQKRMDWAHGKGLITTVLVHEPAGQQSTSRDFAAPVGPFRNALHADAAICNSVQTFEKLSAYARSQKKELPRYVDYVRCEAAPLEQTGRQAPRGGSGTSFRILGIEARGSVGGSDRLAVAYDRLRERFPAKRLSLVCVGQAEDADVILDDERADIEIHRAIDRDRLREMLGKADVAVCPSVSGSIGLVVATCLRAGCPCIAHHEDAGVGADCLPADMHSPLSIERALAQLMQDDRAYEHVSRRAAFPNAIDRSCYLDDVVDKLLAI